MKNLDLKNKVIFISFFMTVSFVLVFALLYYMFDLTNNMEVAIGIGFILLLIINIFFVTFINDLILKDIDLLKSKVEKVRKGVLHESFEINRKDEIGDIFREVGLISNNQMDIISRVKESSQRIDESSKNLRLLIIENKDVINALSKSLSFVNEGTDNQIKGIEDIEFSIEEMAMGIKTINSTVTEVANNANHSVIESKKGNTALEKVVLKMTEIKRNAEESMSTIRLLGSQIKEIQKIVDVIRTISSRTNLLALNATIEAERAGENGEGFIVVAEEIKFLAIKSTESTVKIEKIARNIMERQDKAIEQIEKNSKETRAGIKVVNEASEAFNRILHSTSDIGNQLNEVSSSSEQLSNNTQQIVGNVEKTSEIAKEFSKNTSNVETFVEQQENSIEKLILSIEGLNAMTEDINEFLSKYKR